MLEIAILTFCQMVMVGLHLDSKRDNDDDDDDDDVNSVHRS